MTDAIDLDVHLAAIAAGDPVAFGRWVAGCELRLRRSLAGFAAQVDVEAVLQETLLRVWQVAPRVEPDERPNALVRFAVRVARNCAISELRRLGGAPRQAISEADVDAAGVDAAGDALPDPLLRDIIAGCRDALPDKPALALAQRLAHGGGESDRELAARVGMQTNTFLQNITRARKLLAECLDRHGVALAEVLP